MKDNAHQVPEDSRSQERLRLLADEYKSKGEEAVLIRERMIRLVGIAVLVMGVIGSIPYIAATDLVAKSPVFWWCAPGVLGALLAAFVMDYATLNGLVYYRRDLENQINAALGNELVLHFESKFGRAFYSFRSGDRGVRLILLALILGILAIYIGSVALSLSSLSTIHQAESQSYLLRERLLFVAAYAGLGAFLAYAVYRAAFHIRILYKRAKSLYQDEDAESSSQVKKPHPWTTLLVARPAEIITKSLFFWGAYMFGVVYGGQARVWYQIVGAWVCLELFVNQAKYVLNDIYDTGPDSRYVDVRDNPFKGLERKKLRLLAWAAVAKASIGSFIAYWLLNKDIVAAIGIFLLLPLQILYDKARVRFPKEVVQRWLSDFRARNTPATEATRAEAVERVHLIGTDRVPKASRDVGWATGTASLGLLLCAGYAIRLGVPLHLVGVSGELKMFAGYLAWGAALGFALISGYWSWEGAWYAQRPIRFKDSDTNRGEVEYIHDVSRSKAHTLWCYRKLERHVGSRPGFPRSFAVWELIWVLVLVAGPLLAAWTLRRYLNWQGNWAIPIVGGTLFALAYLLPTVPKGLNTLKLISLLLIVVYVAAVIVGYRPANFPFPFMLVPSILAMAFATHYTAGPWSNFDQRYVMQKVRDRLNALGGRLLALLDSPLLPATRK